MCYYLYVKKPRRSRFDKKINKSSALNFKETRLNLRSQRLSSIHLARMIGKDFGKDQTDNLHAITWDSEFSAERRSFHSFRKSIWQVK